ncbi:hypothetical protein DSAG12_01635 [Promethearchaeum syntrophicum]|uniref:Haloacid dehalogenase-like hydrolase n=1 Tax=Promethearchaeum syntrophicum TaxID=2594042 RepID=A0A5B9D953_9ARCH|nr:hypothetical protein [Candidatus Prometheoarchaeum syntrophicum]QEE15808.1 hypothetical protein DSAG12_01635 [Candidatus Prometheoarchaeum syntrophicum]
MITQFSFVLGLDNIVLNNYWRKYFAYLKIGWDDASIRHYLSKKEYMMQIASFNTRTVSFSASSRRNRFYEIYNRPDMLEQDVAWDGSIEAIKKISQKFKIYIISSRSTELRKKTLEVMKKLGFPMENLTLYFKNPNESLSIYRKNSFNVIKEEYVGGVGVCLNISDRYNYERIGYTPIAFSSINDYKSFDGKIAVICQNWTDILHSLSMNGN